MNVHTLSNLSSGLYVIGAKDGERNVGCVVNTVVQATSNPITITVCIHKDNYTNACIKKNKEFSVSVLAQNISEAHIGVFGFRSSRDEDKFSQVSTGITPSGMPYLKEGATSYIQCKVLDFVDNFTHTIFVAEVQEAEILSKEPNMTYEYYHRVIKGKAPKNASSYIEGGEAISKTYKCSICGYEYSGSKEEFEGLSDDFQCPICGMEKELFKL